LLEGRLLASLGVCLEENGISDKAIAAGEERAAEQGEIYFIRVGFTDVTSETWSVNNYHLHIGDTFVVKDTDNEIMTKTHRRY
jgi:nucleosome binding factor SPN SPT16 subunit